MRSQISISTEAFIPQAQKSHLTYGYKIVWSQILKFYRCHSQISFQNSLSFPFLLSVQMQQQTQQIITLNPTTKNLKSKIVTIAKEFTATATGLIIEWIQAVANTLGIKEAFSMGLKYCPRTEKGLKQQHQYTKVPSASNLVY